MKTIEAFGTSSCNWIDDPSAKLHARTSTTPTTGRYIATLGRRLVLVQLPHDPAQRAQHLDRLPFDTR